MDEGYIKFRYKAINDSVPDLSCVEDLIDLRTKLYDLGLIGFKDGVSFGNLSKRLKANEFIITISNIGRIRILQPEHFATVSFVEINNNYVEYKGKYPPSSETITHFAVYYAFQKANYVVHFHHYQIWEETKNKFPSTPEDKSYGTVELARAIIDIRSKFKYEPSSEIIVLGGHEAGLLVFGTSTKLVLEKIQKVLHNQI